MICKPCSAEEHRRAPRNGQDVDFEEKSTVHVPIIRGRIIIALYQCPNCKDVRLESEME